MKRNSFKGTLVLFFVVGIGLLFTISANATSGYIVARPGALDHFVVAAPAQAVAGETFSVKIEARDVNDNTIVDFDSLGAAVEIATNGSGVITPTTIPASNFTNGLATVAVAHTKAESVNIIIKDRISGKSGTSHRIKVRPGRVDHFVVSAPPTITSGESFTVKLAARDAYDNPIPDYDRIGRGVDITTTGAGTVIPQEVAASSFKNGMALIDFIYDKAETFAIMAREKSAPISKTPTPRVEMEERAKIEPKGRPQIGMEKRMEEARKHLESAKDYILRDEYRKAKKELTETLRLDPTNSEARSLLKRIEKLIKVLTIEK